ncbi:hypothetical protein EVS84_22385 [Pseudomonas koreensis]|uniref:Uncharacterized protein n=1 Tax=Pseudomonas koreensis TaxID=198620 RepID=A0A4Q4KWT6_9PSED|nr:hypothetical protein EVS84_22385 [Pseudomonas koreensis]
MSLLAIAVDQSPLMLDEIPLSRAGSLLQWNAVKRGIVQFAGVLRAVVQFETGVMPALQGQTPDYRAVRGDR